MIEVAETCAATHCPRIVQRIIIYAVDGSTGCDEQTIACPSTLSFLAANRDVTIFQIQLKLSYLPLGKHFNNSPTAAKLTIKWCQCMQHE